jgi:tripartite-type tricarboxylate transporter receptor subunit TctC
MQTRSTQPHVASQRGLRRRHLLLAALPCVATAQTSTKPIHIVVPFTPGGGNDVFARQIAKGLAELRGQAVIVENKPGASGTIGTEQVVRSSDVDGTTLLLGHTGTISINPALYRQLKFDPRTDLIPVAMFASAPLVLVVPAGSPARSVRELIAQAQNASGGVSCASSGSGTGSHLTGELFAQLAGVKLTHVPYRGTSPALTDLVGGQVQMMFCVLPPALALVKGARLRAIAVTSAARLPDLPGVPTVAESGVESLAGFESSLTYGLLAPRRTPETLIRELGRQIVSIASSAAFQSGLAIEGATSLIGEGPDYAALIRRESTKWANIVRSSGATAE